MKVVWIAAGCAGLGGLALYAALALTPALDIVKARSTAVPAHGVVATVNGTPLYLRQLEALADINAPTVAAAHNLSLEELRADYAANLNQLIVQALVRQELDERGLRVGDDETTRLESLISAGYKQSPGADFTPFIEDAGIAPDLWREQLRARLELERWQKELSSNTPVGEGEVEAYIAAHPEVRDIPERVEYLLLSGKDRETLEKALRTALKDDQALRDKGFDARRLRHALTGAPDVWHADLARMNEGQASAIRQVGTGWQCLILLRRHAARARTPVELYAHVEALLAEQKLPAAFDEWLTRAIMRADIRIAEPLLPANVTRPAPRPLPSPPPATGEEEDAQDDLADEGTA